MLSNALDSYEAIINSDPHCIKAIQERCTRLHKKVRCQCLQSINALLNNKPHNTLARMQNIEAKIAKVYVGLNPVPELLAYSSCDKRTDLSADMQKAGLIAMYMGISELRAEQKAVIHASLAGKSALVDFPTGFGKSVCFILPALLQTSITVVIVPFVSIIESHLHSFASLHANAPDLSAMLGSQLPISIHDLVGCFIGKDNRARYLKKELHPFAMDYRTILELCNKDSEHGKGSPVTGLFNKRLIYTTPESFLILHDTVWYPLAQSKRLNRIVVDECHILITWAFLFKKDYIVVCKKASWLQRIFHTNLSLLSGSLTEAKRNLLLSWIWSGSGLYYFTIDRIIPSNVRFIITRCADQGEVLQRGLAQAEHYVSKSGTTPMNQGNLDCKGIIFCLTKGECVTICKLLKSKGISALPFHSTTNNTLSTIAKADVVVATSSLSHGVDLHDVNFVVVCGCCFSINELIQYGGRCGRRGQPADYHFIYSSTDMLRSLHLKLVTEQDKPEKIVGVGDMSSQRIRDDLIKYTSFFSTEEFFQLGRFLEAVSSLDKQDDIKNSLSQYMKQAMVDSGEDVSLKHKQIFVTIVLLIYYLTTAFNMYKNKIVSRPQTNPSVEPPLAYRSCALEPTYQDSRLTLLVRLDFIVAILTGNRDHVKCILIQCFSNDYLSGKKFSLAILASALLDQLTAYRSSLLHEGRPATNKSEYTSRFESILNFASSNHLPIPRLQWPASAKRVSLDDADEDDGMTPSLQLKVDETESVVEILQSFVKKVLKVCCCTNGAEQVATEKEIIDTVLYFLQIKGLYIESAADPCRHVYNVRVSASTSNFCLILWTRTAELFVKYMGTFAWISKEYE